MGAYAWVPYRHSSLHVLTIQSRYPAPAPASPPACFALLRAAADPLMYTLLTPHFSSLSPSPSVAYNTPHLTKMKRTFTDTRPGSLRRRTLHSRRVFAPGSLHSVPTSPSYCTVLLGSANVIACQTVRGLRRLRGPTADTLRTFAFGAAEEPSKLAGRSRPVVESV
ncbi:hypothetical protein K466DRAFT_63178 [Polyporus arcularius HHB13444]|uniref:Uncharacterized protein n=1 Tax=Polyporus arcularius HHB13444 TaxID=1314778 RepID=A0A5C3NPT6_9APHY|nr:hypothetical protein K466DRAFT_63178 [Polyporus arcularius HHB13444]